MGWIFLASVIVVIGIVGLVVEVYRRSTTISHAAAIKQLSPREMMLSMGLRHGKPLWVHLTGQDPVSGKLFHDLDGWYLESNGGQLRFEADDVVAVFLAPDADTKPNWSN